LLFAWQKATLICGNAATSLGESPHHLQLAATSFAPRRNIV
jgi:hypothetical protein